MPSVSHTQMANALRALSMDAVQKAGCGHPGMPMGMADVAAVLFRDFLKFSAAHPRWHDRDRFILSAGHGSMLLYALLHCCGYRDFPLDELKRFRQIGARTAGHPEYGLGGGIETTTGPLGQGLANAVGMAIAERLLAAEFGAELCDHRTWVIAGDGCLMEGISHEAASLAGHLRLNKLVVLYDDNNISIDGDTALAVSDDTPARFAACGWRTLACDGHAPDDIARALGEAAGESDKPVIVSCRTVIGYGAPNKQGTAAAHGAALGDDEIAGARARLNWPHAPFVIPDDILAAWRAVGKQGDAVRAGWQKRLQAHARGEEFLRRADGELPAGWDAGLRRWQGALTAENGKMATRQASGEALKNLLPRLPQLLGGSADLTGSNNTHVGQTPARADGQGGLSGAYLHYGVREHGMAAAMNGIALHGGFIPYGGTFLVFSDYCRPAIRLSALTGAHVVYVMTHDSIGLGEDGPTHQPVEHLAALRAMPNLRVWRPADAGETAECWRLAVLHRSGPTLLALSRQALPFIGGDAAQCARGAYVVAGDDGRHITLAASGSEVALALAARELLAARGIAAAVVSAPCLELFLQETAAWQNAVMPPQIPLLTIEAAATMPWRALAATLQIRRADFAGIGGFGVSAPAAAAFEHFGLTPEKIAENARRLIKQVSS